MTTESPRTALSISEAAALWGVSQFTLRRFIGRGLLRVFNVGSRRLIPD